MSKINDGGAAFPYYETGDCGVLEGMSLRDYFAAKAMHAALVTAKGYDSFERVAKNSADLAYMIADSMLAARKSHQPEQQQSPGWIEWNGGECPVPKGASFFVRFRDGDECAADDGAGLVWVHEGHAGDIIAYRIVSNGDQK